MTMAYGQHQHKSDSNVAILICLWSFYQYNLVWTYLDKSAVIAMQKLLNKDALEKRDILRKISNYMPVNYDCMQSISLWK